MCLLCVEIQKDKLTVREIARNYNELVDEEHWVEVLVEIEKKGLVKEVGDELLKLQGVEP